MPTRWSTPSSPEHSTGYPAQVNMPAIMAAPSGPLSVSVALPGNPCKPYRHVNLRRPVALYLFRAHSTRSHVIRFALLGIPSKPYRHVTPLPARGTARSSGRLTGLCTLHGLDRVNTHRSASSDFRARRCASDRLYLSNWTPSLLLLIDSYLGSYFSSNCGSQRLRGV